MNRKQAGIILTLLALIVCAGILAARVNGQVDDGTGSSLSSSLSFTKDSDKDKDKDKQTSNTKDYFYDSRNDREQQDSQTMQSLKSIIEDKNTSADQKTEAQKKLTALTMARDYETRIELSIKGKGFDDALCLIEGNKARVIVKSKDNVNEKQSIQIQDSVASVAKIKDIVIESKQ
ncbi:SpoIIIAH-like family protein [Clostridium manihotivorum]|uniref:Stage III sporulation protein AH n=1 Tax=Clostridium manihotivorum TaxID=2320868 RepID=A0A410DSN1_9CLOT|nr:SpoIIIAH-like family protein [Clostridium manihotivorum]QAA32065.1 stage III sporulation protein AH [Clostridium manihotivorum]